LPDEICDLYKRSTLVIRTQVDNRGAIIAANDSDVLRFNRDTYSYLWPRDGALVADALDLAGYGEVTRRFFELCGTLITREGYLSRATHQAACAVVRPLGGAPRDPCLHHRGGLGGAHRRAELRSRVWPARAREALRRRGHGDPRRGAHPSVGRRPWPLSAHGQHPSGRHNREGRDDRHLPRRHLPLRPPPRERSPRCLDDERDRTATLGENARGRRR